MINRIKSLFGALGASLLSMARYGSPDDTPGGRWWVSWQNLSKADGKGDLPVHGRVWLSFAPFGESKFRFEWHWMPLGATSTPVPVPLAPPPASSAPSSTRGNPIEQLNRMFDSDPELAPRLIREGKLFPHDRPVVPEA